MLLTKSHDQELNFHSLDIENGTFCFLCRLLSYNFSIHLVPLINIFLNSNRYRLFIFSRLAITEKAAEVSGQGCQSNNTLQIARINKSSILFIIDRSLFNWLRLVTRVHARNLDWHCYYCISLRFIYVNILSDSPVVLSLLHRIKAVANGFRKSFSSADRNAGNTGQNKSLNSHSFMKPYKR